MTRFKAAQRAALAAVVATSLSACVFTAESADKPSATVGGEAPVELTGELTVESFYPEGSPDYERLEVLAADFEEKHPDLDVTIKFLGGAADRTGIEALWRNGNPPEVSVGFFEPAAPDGGEWVADGKVLALDEAMQRPLEGSDSTWQDAILPGVVPLIQASGDGTTYGVPESVTTIQFFYNKAMFEENGIAVPTTFAELLGAAEQLKAIDVAPFTVTGTFLPYMQLYWDYLALRYIGAEGVQQAIAGETELAALPGAAEAAQSLETLVGNDNLLAGFKSTDFTAAQMAFFQGKAGMILMGSWLVGEMKDSIPEDFEVGTFSFPIVDGGSGDPEGLFGGVNAQVVAAESDNPEAGVEWERFIASEEHQTAYVTGTGSISPYRGVPSPPGFEDVTAALEEGAAFAPSYFGVLAQSQQVQTAYNQPIAELFFGEIDGAEMLQKMSKGLAQQ